MNETLPPKDPTVFFNYTLLLDDFIQPPLGPFSEDAEPSPVLLESPGKCSMNECITQALTNASQEGSPMESPLKFETFDKHGKNERLRKSDGALYLNSQNKGLALKDFLSDNDFDEMKEKEISERRNWNFDFFGEIVGVGETLSDGPRENVSNFSLSSCFKNNLSEFTLSSFMNKKKRAKVKISGKKLRRVVGRRHFDMVLRKLSKVVEFGGNHPS